MLTSRKRPRSGTLPIVWTYLDRTANAFYEYKLRELFKDI